MGKNEPETKELEQKASHDIEMKQRMIQFTHLEGDLTKLGAKVRGLYGRMVGTRMDDEDFEGAEEEEEHIEKETEPFNPIEELEERVDELRDDMTTLRKVLLHR